MTPHVIGVDGGGTWTRLILADAEGRELAQVVGPASLADPARPEAAAEVVARTAERAAGEAGVELPVDALHAGLAGVGREGVRSAVEHALGRLGIARRVRVDTDVHAAFHHVFADGPGILLVAGTGSIARGRAEDGREARVGGWGTLIGDEGSGYSIGLEALRRVARAADGRGPDTGLTGALLRAAGVDEPEGLIAWSGAAAKAEVAALVPAVETEARAGDAVAREILARAVEELEGHVLTLLEALGPWGEPPHLALSGGLLTPGGPLRDPVERALRRHRLERVAEEPDAVRGALELARGMVRDT